MRCINDTTALLDLWTKRTKLTFEIKPLSLKLIENKIPELQHLVDTEFSPGYLLQELQKSGIHLMPRPEDAKIAGIQQKDIAAEERAIMDVACSVRAFHYRRSKWNQDCGSHKGVSDRQVLLRIRENLEFDREFLEDYEPDWRYVSWWNNKVTFMEGCKDTDEVCDARIMEGQLTHSLLSQSIVPPFCSDQAHAITTDFTEVEFINTVKQTLRLIRLFSFS